VFDTPDVDTQTVKHFDRAMRYIHDIKFGMLQVRNNEISLRKCSGGSAQLRTLEGTLVTRESARFDNNDSCCEQVLFPTRLDQYSTKQRHRTKSL